MTQTRRVELMLSAFAIFLISLMLNLGDVGASQIILYAAIVGGMSLLLYFALTKMRFLYKYKGLGGGLFVAAFLLFRGFTPEVPGRYVLLFLMAFFISNLVLVIKKSDDFFEPN